MKQLLKGLLPPLLVAGARRITRGIRRSRSPEFEYVPEGWARTDAGIRGWNVESVLNAYRAKLPSFREALEGSGPIGLATSAAVPLGEPNFFDQNTVLAFAYALLLASRNTGRVSVLDWGGGLGFHYYLSRALLPDDVEIDYHCKDMPIIGRHGREAVPEITFWDDDKCLADRYDLVFASSSLQYTEAWTDLFTDLARASRKYLFLTRVPVVLHNASFVILQRIRPVESEFLSWVFNRQELLDSADRAGMTLVREFLLGRRVPPGYKPLVAGAPEQDEIRAYLFTRSPS